MSTLPSALEKSDFSEVGDRLRAARAKVGMTRRQLAVASGSSERYLAQIEAGVANPSLSVLTGLATALDLALADLLPKGGERSAAYMEAAAAVRRLPREGLEAFNRWIAKPPEVDLTRGKRILMLGLRGAGKSSLGHALAERLQVPFFEISKQVELAYGAEIGLLIELSGQAALRRYESEVWESITEKYDAAVIAAPGGIVADAPIFDRMLATSHSIWLKATPEDHMERVMAQGDFRPMASNRSAMADLKAILHARSGEYARADAQLDTSQQGFSETLNLVEAVARDLIGGLDVI
jgi:XRE family aerobic/anaerobic benzoate catabolism transcriptional regulator